MPHVLNGLKRAATECHCGLLDPSLFLPRRYVSKLLAAASSDRGRLLSWSGTNPFVELVNQGVPSVIESTDNSKKVRYFEQQPNPTPSPITPTIQLHHRLCRCATACAKHEMNSAACVAGSRGIDIIIKYY